MKKNNINYGFTQLLGKFFTEYLPKTINVSNNTIKSYKCTFRLLLNYLNEETDIDMSNISFETLNFELLTAFFNWLIEKRKNSMITAKQRMGALSSFADYAQSQNIETGYIFYNSLVKISKKKFRRIKSKQRCTFTRSELKILFSLPDTYNKIGWRDLVVLAVMYSSGARAQEICNLTLRDISYDENNNAILTLIGKGEKSRRVKITADTTKILNQYLSSRKIGLDNYIFSSQRNEKMSVSCIEEIFEKYIKIAKEQNPDKFCSGRYTPHVMRHTTATHLIEAGVPLAIVKNILGHTSILTTQIYLDISQQTIDDSIKQWNEKWFDNTCVETGTNNSKLIPDFLM